MNKLKEGTTIRITILSCIALDQMHEQLIGSLKGDGGIIGLTENPEALRRFMIAGPELTCIID